MILVFYPKTPCEDQCQETFPLFIVLGVFQFQVLCVSLIHFDLCVWCKIKVQFYSFTCEYGVLLTLLIEETVLSSLYILDTLVKD